jgi:hypothetical protein
MKKTISLLCALVLGFQVSFAQEKEEGWKFGGGIGLDFAQMLLINPKVGAGENKIAIGGNSGFNANYKKGRLSWNSKLGINLGVQKLGSGKKPFQKTLDEVRLTSIANYAIAEGKPWGYALDFTFLSQLTPTYEGNTLSASVGTANQYSISKFLSPATIVVSPGISYKPNDNLSVLISPLSYKTIIVADDSIAKLGNTARTASIHGNPFGSTVRQDFIDTWRVKPTGMTYDSVFYAKNTLQLGATIKAQYQNKFLKDKEGKARIGFSTSLTLFSDYLRNPQFIDVEWITTTDFFIFKGLSISLGTNLFYDHDVLVQINEDGDANTGPNGLESTGRRVSFTQTLLIKYNFLF